MEKTYLGDGVYVAIENGMIKLTTEDGYNITNTIYLELEVYQALRTWAKPYIHGANYGKAID